jgi:hypothetical protein
LRLFAIALLLHPLGAAGVGETTRRDDGLWRGAPRLQAALSGVERLSIERCRLPEGLDSPCGPEKRRFVDRSDGLHDARPTPLVVEGAFAAGELPAAQSFLRRNGSANANGKRA